MKLATSIAISLLASVAIARPRAKDSGDPASQTSRVTAFVIDDKGNPSVECWEINSLSSSQKTAGLRADGSKSSVYVTPLTTTGSELDGLDLLTWPEPQPIWPPPSDWVGAEWFDLGGSFSLFAVQGGLIRFSVNAHVGSTANDEWPDHIFSLENGDDWFYFEDSTDSNSVSSANAEPPFSVSTVSGGTTSVLQLKYARRPSHKVLHKGGCSFTGVVLPEDLARSNAKTSPALSVQVNIEESRGL